MKERSAALTAEQRCSIASDAGCGLHYLHSEALQPLIHQGVKSDNVLLAVDPATALAAGVVAPAEKRSRPHHPARVVAGTTPHIRANTGHVSQRTETRRGAAHVLAGGRAGCKRFT